MSYYFPQSGFKMLIFDDHIRSLAARQRLSKGRLRARHLKLQKIAAVLDLPANFLQVLKRVSFIFKLLWNCTSYNGLFKSDNVWIIDLGIYCLRLKSSYRTHSPQVHLHFLILVGVGWRAQRGAPKEDPATPKFSTPTFSPSILSQ